MNCPYCAEEVKDQAIVCRHCSRDLTFFRPFDERLRAVEERLQTLTDSLERVVSALGSVGFADISTSTVVGGVHGISVSLGYSLATLATYTALNGLVLWVNFQTSITGNAQNALLVIYLVLPLLPGFLLGLKVPFKHFARLLLFAIAFEAIDLTQCILTKGFKDLEEFVIISGFLLIKNLALAFLGALIGDWTARKLHPVRGRKSMIHQIAVNLASRSNNRVKASGQMSFEDRMKRWTIVVQVVSAILAALTTITVAYIGYNTELVKKATRDPKQQQQESVK